MLNYSTVDGEPVISPKQGETVFPCGCWLKMDYARECSIVDGNLCEAHGKLADILYGTETIYGETVPDSLNLSYLIEDGFLIKGANVS